MSSGNNPVASVNDNVINDVFLTNGSDDFPLGAESEIRRAVGPQACQREVDKTLTGSCISPGDNPFFRINYLSRNRVCSTATCVLL